jgi:HD-GYP domain-containing protein (c-di-GMP phosphodiesterase class II)
MIAQGATEDQALDDSQFRPVLVEEFLSARPCPYDAFARIAPGRYIRVLNANDRIEPERVHRFIDLGARHFYIRLQAFNRCLDYCDLLSKMIGASEEISPEVKLLHLAGMGEETHRLIRSLAGKPLTVAHVDAANAYLSQVAMLVQRTKKNQKELVADFLRNATLFEHAVSVTLATALMAPAMGIESPVTWAQLGLATFFHDIGLYELPAKLVALDNVGVPASTLEIMTPPELEKFRRHPVRSAEIMRANPIFEEATLLAVLQHHERRDGLGFPRRLGPEQISVFAEIIGICDEFIRLLKRQENEPEFNTFEAMSAEVFNGFSFRTIKAFRSVFM